MELPRRNRRSGPARPARGLFEDELYQDDSYQDDSYQNDSYPDDSYPDDSYPDELYQSPYEDQGYQDQGYQRRGRPQGLFSEPDYEEPRYGDRRQRRRFATQRIDTRDYAGYEDLGYSDRRSRRRGPGRLVMVLGSVLALAGAAVIGRAVAERGHVYGPAEQIPANVGTSVPGLDGAVAAPLAFSRPVQIEIPKLDVDAPVMRLGLAANHTVAVPPLEDHNLAGWYDGSVTPGQKGTSVILGHVDSFTGISVFFYIKTLRRGNQIKIMRANGSTAIFTVDGVQKVAKSAFPTSDVYGQARYPGLRLITCGGQFDTATRQYLDNIVVYAHLTRTIRGSVR
jgi:sortase (surface protein transpeptidase)